MKVTTITTGLIALAALTIILTINTVALAATEKSQYTGTGRDGQREDVDTSKDK